LVGGNAPHSWLCRTDAQRERVVDMEGRIKRPRAISFAILAAALVASGPWIGWWTLVPMTLAGIGFAVAGQAAARSRRPEMGYAAAWLVAQVAIAFSIALTGGVDSPALSWLAIPVVTLSARFDGHGVTTGMLVTALLMLAVTVGLDPGATLASPQNLVFPMALLLAVASLSTALMRSDLEHRNESVVDVLTGMLNRRSLESRIAELEQQAAVTGETIGFIVGDIDCFKSVNDTHGHPQGDAVLVDVAYTMRKELRAFDLAYRVGGEEFLVVLPGASPQDAADLAERLRLAIELSPAGGMQVTMSFGVATSSPGPFAFAELFGAADAALFEAKRAGRNRVVTAETDALQPTPA
jgi:diguanylate cyclase (GGDEF)-like protein